MRRIRGLGELPQELSRLRGETYPPQSPYGLPPPASDYVATSAGEIAKPSETLDGSRSSLFQVITFVAQPSAQKIQDNTLRKYFLIQNKSNSGTIYLGFGYQPDVNNGIVLPPGVAYEPYSFPINDVWVSSDVPNTIGILIYGI